jgi:hypothetical protein
VVGDAVARQNSDLPLNQIDTPLSPISPTQRRTRFPKLKTKPFRTRMAFWRGTVTLAIVVLIPRSDPAWLVAFHRFDEVSVGIGVALLLSVIWPEREATPSS